jgi:hypothetical protein
MAMCLNGVSEKGGAAQTTVSLNTPVQLSLYFNHRKSRSERNSLISNISSLIRIIAARESVDIVC